MTVHPNLSSSPSIGSGPIESNGQAPDVVPEQNRKSQEMLQQNSPNLVSSNRILIVDDKIENLNLLSQMLEQQSYEVRRAISGRLALQAAQKWQPNLILLDITMPEMSGYEVCRNLKDSRSTSEIPVIFISALNGSLDKVKAFSLGGADYITKPFEISEVLARVKNQLSLQAAKAQILHLNDGLERRVEQRTAQLQTVNQSLEQEIIKRQTAQEQLLHLAFHDALTDLPNRAQLLAELKRALQQAKQREDYRFAVLLLDCDRFKLVNDSLGHVMGDRLIIAIAQRLQTILPTGTTLARLGGDEFAIFLRQLAPNHLAEQQAKQVAHQIQAELSNPFWLNGYELFMTVSIGIAIADSRYAQPEDILRDSDTAMYYAKDLGKAQCCCFDPQMYERALARLTLDSQMRRALEKEEFSLAYQPIVSVETEQITGFEALLRWHHPVQGFISPAQFIPVAEETGVIVPLGLWVLREACRQIKIWQHLYQQQNQTQEMPWKMSVNLSVQQFSQPDLIVQIDRILAETGVAGRWLKLEITETAFMENADSATTVLQALKQRQIELAIDDFGTGYSSLSYLHRFPVDTLKVDQSFVKGLVVSDALSSDSAQSCVANLAEDSRSTKSPATGIEANAHDLRIVKAAINLAHDLGMDVVAEGIETAAVLARLKALGCDLGQGYFFAKPLAADPMTAWLGLVGSASDPRDESRSGVSDGSSLK